MGYKKFKCWDPDSEPSDPEEMPEFLENDAVEYEAMSAMYAAECFVGEECASDGDTFQVRVKEMPDGPVQTFELTAVVEVTFEIEEIETDE